MSNGRRELETSLPQQGETLQDFLRYTASLSPHHDAARSAFSPGGVAHPQAASTSIDGSREARDGVLGRGRKRVASDSQRNIPYQTHPPRRRRDQHASYVGSTGQGRSSGNTRTAGTSTANAIDPETSPPRNTHNTTPPLPGPQLVSETEPTAGAESEEPLYPRWQPDEEAASCTICSRPFSLLIRRHHCRKCGKIVCGWCSGHRIRLMRACVARTPGTAVTAETASTAATGVGAAAGEDISDPWGLVEVRVCNPCVPDPNVDGVRGMRRGSHPHVHPHSSHFTLPEFPTSRAHLGSLMYTPSMAPRHAASASASASASLPSHMHSHRHTGYLPSYSSTRRSTTSGHGHTPPPRTMFAFGPQNTSQHQRRRGPSPSHSQSHSHSYSHSAQTLPPYHVNEADLCPVCRRELPPGDPSDDDAERAAHVVACITQIDARRSSRSLSHADTGASARPSYSPPHASSSSRGGFVRGAVPVRTSSQPTTHHRSQSSSSSVAADPPARAAPLLTWTAGEKDCVDGGGGAAECVICLEEFEPGQELGRMECFCKFHRACVEGWWRAKGERRCPTHAMRD